MTSPDGSLPVKLQELASRLNKLAVEYRELKFTASEEAMRWPIAVMEDEDGVGIWCNQFACTISGHGSELSSGIDLDNFTVADLLFALVDHIEYNSERVADGSFSPQDPMAESG